MYGWSFSIPLNIIELYHDVVTKCSQFLIFSSCEHFLDNIWDVIGIWQINLVSVKQNYKKRHISALFNQGYVKRVSGPSHQNGY
jgi:hypothetical protein